MTRAADDLADRLAAIRRDFPRALDLGDARPSISRRSVAAGGRPTPCARRGRSLAGRRDRRDSIVVDEEAPALRARKFRSDRVGHVAAMGQRSSRRFRASATLPRRPTGCFSPAWPAAPVLSNCAPRLAQAEDEICGGASPRVSPFVDVRDLGGLLQRAGFALPVADVDAFTLRYDSMFALCDELRAMGAANALDRTLAQTVAPLGVCARGGNLRRAFFRRRRTRARELRDRLALRLGAA